MSEKLSHIYWSDEHLHNEVLRLEKINQPWLGPERRQAVQRQIGHIVFEQTERYREEHEEVDVERFTA